MSVAQVGCKNRQPTFDVFARSIPADQSLDSEAMSIIPLPELAP